MKPQRGTKHQRGIAMKCHHAALSLGFLIGVLGTAPHANGGQARNPVNGPPLLPRPRVDKPAHTQITQHFNRSAICVKFRDGLSVRLRNGALTDFGTGALAPAQRLLAHVANGRWERSHRISEDKLDALRITAEKTLGKAVADLNLQFNLTPPEGC